MSQRRASRQLPMSNLRPTVVVKTREEEEAWVGTMERLGLHHTNQKWERLDWWVRFCQRSVPALSLEDKYRLQQELAVLERLGTRYEVPIVFEPPPPFPFAQIEVLRLQVLTMLGLLADTGYARMGPFWIVWDVHQYNTVDPRGRMTRRADRGVVPSLTRSESPSRREDTFLIQLLDLLRTVPQGIRRCLHCKRLFLQVKRQSRYCGRDCQSVAAMRQIRAQSKTRHASNRKATERLKNSERRQRGKR